MMRSRHCRRVFLATVVVLLLASAPAAGQEMTGLQAAAALEKAMVDVIAKSEKSVVAVARARKGDAESRLTDPSFIPNEFGTGVVIDRRGLILTNLHVLGKVDKNEYAVWIDRRPHRATVKATDPWSDLAILEIEADSLTPIMLGDASALKKGQIVIALGNPYAIARDGDVCATWGIVSNLSRKAPPVPDPDRPGGKKTTLHHYGTLIQTDARLHLGTSGGALLNLKGQMVGLTTSLAARAGYEKSVGYAIPVDATFKRVLKSLKEGREVEFGFLGVGPGVGPTDLSYHDRRQGKHGVRVTRVVAGTPAATAGLRDDDVITHIDDRPVYDADDLILQVSAKPVETVVQLTVQRGEGRSVRKVQKKATLSKKAPDPDRPAVATEGQIRWRGMKIDYATAIPGFQRHSYIGRIDPDGCVAVVDVDRGSPAFEAGLRTGMFISHVGRTRVATPRQFHAAVADKRGSVWLRFSPGPRDPVTRAVAPE